jgi:hypothetical protein
MHKKQCSGSGRSFPFQVRSSTNSNKSAMHLPSPFSIPIINHHVLCLDLEEETAGTPAKLFLLYQDSKSQLQKG